MANFLQRDLSAERAGSLAGHILRSVPVSREECLLIDLPSEHLRNAAKRYPHATAIAFQSRELSWADLDRAVDRLALRLVAAGLLSGRSVAIMSDNSPEFLILCFAVWRVGGVMAIVHASFAPSKLDYAFSNAEPNFVFAEKNYLAAGTEALRRTNSPAQIFELTDGIELFDHLSISANTLPQVDPSAIAIIAYTSGTTGTPKPVAHSHRSLARASAAYAEIWRLTEHDICLLAIPLSWMAGLFVVSLTATVKGAKIVMLRQFDATEALSAMVEQGVTFIAGSTTMYVKIVNAWHNTQVEGDFQLRCCFSGGEFRNETVFEEWRRMTGTAVLDIYGASECMPIVTYDPAIDIEPYRGSAGKLMADCELRIIGPDGSRVAPGEVGEAQARSPFMMTGYWREPELTAKTITPDRWYNTGDFVRIDSDGYVYVLGRTSDLIVRDGRHIYPAEIEQIISELDYVAAVAVVGLPDPVHGQSIAAAIVVRPGATIDDAGVRAHCAARLEASKVPTIIRAVKKLPYNASNKVLRREVAPFFEDAGEP
jgi:acyl-CoA synthetase (AMP-forming)/AMP-acid ligase II